MNSIMKEYIISFAKNRLTFVVVIVLGFIVGNFSYKLKIFDEPTSMLFSVLLILCSLVGFFVFIHMDRKKTRDKGVLLLREVKDIISGGNIEKVAKDTFLIRGIYKNKNIESHFINERAAYIFTQIAEIIFRLKVDKMPEKSILSTLLCRVRKITQNVSLVSGNILVYQKDIRTIYSAPNRRQELLNILDELVRAGEMVG